MIHRLTVLLTVTAAAGLLTPRVGATPPSPDSRTSESKEVPAVTTDPAAPAALLDSGPLFSFDHELDLALDLCPTDTLLDTNLLSLAMLQETAGAGVRAEGDLAKAAQNPVADLISLPFQYNLNFNVGPDNDPQHVLNIQPVIPFHLNDDWNLITRTIVPVVQQPMLFPGDDDDFGLGDIQFTAFLSPRKSEGLTWGVGPAIRIPTATHRDLGSEQLSIGPSAVILNTDGPWVYGALVQNLWSVAGDDGRSGVNTMLMQPFVNYNLDNGWYLTSSPVITANWMADRDSRWTVPIGGGFGKIFRVGDQPMNFQTQGFYNLEHPDNASEWGIRIQLQLLFPK